MIYTPPAIPTGVPSQLLERRPDVAAAERTLAAANATIGIGYGAFFPAGHHLGERRLRELHSSSICSTGPAASGPSGPRPRRPSSTADSTAPSCTSTRPSTTPTSPPTGRRSLTAFQQVEDALAATRIYSQQILQQQEAVKSAQQFLDLEMQRYQHGVDPYVDVVTAQTTLLSDQQTLNALQVSRMISAVQLVQALGGGWDRSQLPPRRRPARRLRTARTPCRSRSQAVFLCFGARRLFGCPVAVRLWRSASIILTTFSGLRRGSGSGRGLPFLFASTSFFTAAS